MFTLIMITGGGMANKSEANDTNGRKKIRKTWMIVCQL